MEIIDEPLFDSGVVAKLGRRTRRVHAVARSRVAQLNTLAARVEQEIDAILRGDLIAVRH
jgi:hypothetical protein